jgi:hypothetical protein
MVIVSHRFDMALIDVSRNDIASVDVTLVGMGPARASRWAGSPRLPSVTPSVLDGHSGMVWISRFGFKRRIVQPRKLNSLPIYAIVPPLVNFDACGDRIGTGAGCPHSGRSHPGSADAASPDDPERTGRLAFRWLDGRYSTSRSPFRRLFETLGVEFEGGVAWVPGSPIGRWR